MFLQNLRAKVGARLNGDSEAGFTLIELLVVMLILGILAAIAIPAFFNQREKAKDASAKSMARTAETSMETFATENGGSYVGVTDTDLHNIENTITLKEETSGEVSNQTPYLSAVSGEASGYSLTITDPSTSNTFTIKRESGSGVPVFECTTQEHAGCPAGGDWSK